jgi:hypothetical protein
MGRAGTRTTVVYVHGNGNKTAREALRGEWDGLLFHRPGGDRSRMVYYADLHYQAPLVSQEVSDGSPPLETLEAVALDPPAPREAFLAELSTEITEQGIAPRADLMAAAARMLDEIPDEALPILEAPDGQAMEVLPSWARERVTRYLTKTFFKDVHRYFFDTSGDAMRQRFFDTVAGLDRVVVVAHSLGTILAYDALHELGDSGPEIPLLVTVGSPLGIQEVQDHVRTPLAVPPRVARWRNIADPFDFVALDKTIADEYAPSARCEDCMVWNQTRNHHSIGGYLDKDEARLPVLAAGV